MKKSLFFALLLLFCWTSLSWGATYYVRADGTLPYSRKAQATNPNSPNTSMSGSTFDDGAYIAGDHVKFSGQGGDYTVNPANFSSGIAGNPVYYEAVEGESPTWTDINSAGFPMFPIAGRRWVVFDGLSLIPVNKATGVSGFRFQSSTSDNITIQNCTIDLSNTGASSRGIWNKDGIDVTNLTLENNTITGARQYDIALTSGGSNIILSGNVVNPGVGGRASLTGVSNLTINNHSITGEGNTTSSMSLCNISGILTIDTMTLTNTRQLEIYNSALDAGSSITGFEGYSVYPRDIYINAGSNITINNMTSESGETVIEIEGASHDIDIINSVITAGGMGILIDGETHNIDIIGNDIGYCSSKAIGFYGNAHDNNVSGNYIHDNGTENIQNGGIVFHGVTYNQRIAYNVIANNAGYGVGTHETTQGWIYNNVFYKNGWRAGNGYRGEISMGVTAPHGVTGTSWVVKNNISYYGTPNVRFTNVSKDLVNCDYNTYYVYNDGQMASLDSGLTFVSWDDYHVAREPHSKIGDPQLVDPENDLFALQSGSPSVDIGTNTLFQLLFLNRR